MARTLDEAKRMLAAARKAGVVNMINFSYRNSIALQHAAVEVGKGMIGRLRHVEASYPSELAGEQSVGGLARVSRADVEAVDPARERRSSWRPGMPYL